MPQIELSPGIAMFYRDDDLTDPWRPSEAVLLLHGNAESGLAWNAWMPHLARRFRVIRPDMRGCGRSTPMPEDHPWALDELVQDFMRVADAAGLKRFHVIATKVGGPIAIQLAISNPERVRTLTLIGTRVTGGHRIEDGRDRIAERGVAGWARQTMAGRLGSDCSPELLEGWIDLMAQTPVSTIVGFHRTFAKVDGAANLERIPVLTLVITTEGSGLGSVAEMRAFQERIPRSELLVLPGDSYHVAVSSPEVCARATLAFIDRVGDTVAPIG